MTRSPPSPNPKVEVQEYEYESDGEELLGNSARALFHESGGNYRCKLGSQTPKTWLTLVSSGASRPLSLHSVTMKFVSTEPCLMQFRRDDRVYVSPAPLSGMLGDSSAATSSETHPTLQSTLRTQNPPKANEVKFLTPPPTPAPPNHLPTPGTTLPTPKPLRDEVTPLKEPGVPDYLPTSVSVEPRFYTPVYPLLVDTKMFEYFGTEYGISKRPPEGEFCSLIGIISLLTKLSNRYPQNVEADPVESILVGGYYLCRHCCCWRCTTRDPQAGRPCCFSSLVLCCQRGGSRYLHVMVCIPSISPSHSNSLF
jgi:hypothetical protein